MGESKLPPVDGKAQQMPSYRLTPLVAILLKEHEKFRLNPLSRSLPTTLEKASRLK